MNSKIPGLHHVTAIASDPQRNLDFYVGILGLRFVKRTVNFDDPGTYHFYFGDNRGTPGTILTFFPWLGVRRGIRGTGQVEATVRFHVLRRCSSPQLHSPTIKHGMNGSSYRRLQKLRRASYEAPLRSESSARPLAMSARMPALISQPLSLDGPKRCKRCR
jgi:hypothetical protein